jgi:sarcosine oxidase/L-pipecolate oxidase
VINQLEGTEDQFTPLWKWRAPSPSSDQNGLAEGEFSGRNLADLKMADEKDWKWT